MLSKKVIHMSYKHIDYVPFHHGPSKYIYYQYFVMIGFQMLNIDFYISLVYFYTKLIIIYIQSLSQSKRMQYLHF